MTIKFLIPAFLFFVTGKEVAYVDLTAPPKTRGTGPQTRWVRGGGILYHGNAPHPLPGTLTISLKLNRILTDIHDPIVKEAVEVIATNVGKGPVSIPIGTDPLRLLKPPAEERREFIFDVKLGDKSVGSAATASNRDHPEADVVLKSGEAVTFLLPIIAPLRNPGEEITVSLGVFRQVMDQGKDWSEGVGDHIHSENSLPLP